MRGVELLSGISLATFAAAGIFFHKFWRASQDRFYLLFCFACWLLAFERITLLYVLDPGYQVSEANSVVYLIRLAAFIFILVAVVDKNRSATRR